MTETSKTPELSKLQLQNKTLENQLAAYRQRIKDLTEHVAKTELDRILLRHGLRDIFELPQLENGIDVHMANINGSNTPDLGKSHTNESITGRSNFLFSHLTQVSMCPHQIMTINC